MIKLVNGNCFVEMTKIPNKSVDLICTDIPYCVSMENSFQTMKDRKGRNGIDFGNWDKRFNIEKLSYFVKLLKPNGSVIIFHSFEQYSDIRKTLEEAGLVCKDKIIWQKTNPMPRNRDRRYISDCEMASWYTLPNSKWTFNRQKQTYESMVMKYPSESGGGCKRYHPTQKNVNMVSALIAIHSNEGDLVLDPFMGSGTTMVACVNSKRNGIGIELEGKYFKIAQERVKQTEANLALSKMITKKTNN